MKPHALVVFVFLVVSLLALVPDVFSVGELSSSTNSVMYLPHGMGLTGSSIAINDDLVIGGNNVTSFVNTSVNMTGNIVVEGNATLQLINATIFFEGQTKAYEYNMTFQNPANGNPRLIAANSSVRSERDSAILFFGNSSAVAEGLSVSYDVEAYADSVLSLSRFSARFMRIFGSSNVTVSESDMRSTKAYVWDSVVFRVLNSTTMDSLYSHDYASVTLSYGAIVNDEFSVSGFSVVSIRDNCTVGDPYRRPPPKGLYVYDSAQVSIFYGMYSYSPQTRQTFGYIHSINAMGFADVSLVSSYVNSMVVSNNVTVKASYCQYPLTRIVSVDAKDFANLSIISSDVKSLILRDRASASVSDSGADDISAVGHSRVVVSQALLETGNYRASDDSQMVISSLTVRPLKAVPFVEGSGRSFVEISNSTLTYSVLRFRENSVASIVNVNATSSRCYIEGHSNISVSSSILSEMVQIVDYSSVCVSSSKLSSVTVEDFSSASLSSSNVTLLHVLEFSNTTLSGCVVDDIWIEALNVNASFSGLRKHGMQSISMNYSLGGFAPSLNLVGTETTGGLDLTFYGVSSVFVADSSIRSLMLADSSTARLENCTVSEAYCSGQARVYVWTRLRVRAVDFFGNFLRGTNVTVTYANGTVVGPRVVDDGGWASFVLFVKMQNATGVFKVGVFSVIASFDTGSAKQFVDLGSNMDITIVLPIPRWVQYLVPSLLIVGVLGLVVVLPTLFRRRKRASELWKKVP